MASLFEYGDRLNSPIESFYCNSKTLKLPVKAHWHYFVEILYVNRGSIHVSCNENDYVLKSGEMIFIPPQVIHAIYNANDDFDYSCIKFSPSKLQFVESYLPMPDMLFRSVMQKKDPLLLFKAKDLKNVGSHQFFDELVNEVSARRFGYHTCVYSMLNLLMTDLIRRWHDEGVVMDPGLFTDTESYSIENVILYIDRHSHENINVTFLSEMCNMSYSYFAKVFHNRYGQSCKQYIEFIRLCKAENLLLFTDHDLTEIANETGFADCSHLIRCFKKHYKTTPKQYRLKHGNI